jgi:hypothetical protein
MFLNLLIHHLVTMFPTTPGFAIVFRRQQSMVAGVNIALDTPILNDADIRPHLFSTESFQPEIQRRKRLLLFSV